VRSADL